MSSLDVHSRALAFVRVLTMMALQIWAARACHTTHGSDHTSSMLA